MTLIVSHSFTAKSPLPHRHADIGKPTFGARPPRDEFMRCPSSDNLPDAARHAERIGEAAGTSSAPRRHARHEIFGLPGLHVNYNVVTTKPSGSPTKTKERYWNVEIPKLGGGKREVWRGESRVEDVPRVGHPGRLMGALQGLLGRRSR